MSETLDMFLGEAVAKLASGPHVGGHEAITKTLMTRLAENREANRSRSFIGLCEAAAEQWGAYVAAQSNLQAAA